MTPGKPLAGTQRTAVRVPRAVALALALALSGCAAVAPAPEVPASPRIDFIDTPGFDNRLGSSLLHSLPEVDVRFYDRLTPSQIPLRLQRWLAEVEDGGGKVSVSLPPDAPTAKSPLLLLGAVSALWSAGKTAREMQEARELRAARGYDADLKLKTSASGEITIDRIVFTPRKP